MDVVVGGAVGERLKDTSRGRPAVSAAARGQVAPAQRGDPCAAALPAPYPLVSGPLSGGAGHFVGSIPHLEQEEVS